MEFTFMPIDYLMGALFGLGLSITIMGRGSRRMVWQLYIIVALVFLYLLK